MANLERRGNRLPRQAREKRAYQLTMATGVLSVVAVVGIVLAAVGVVGAGLPIAAAVLAVLCFVLLRRTIGL